MSMSNALETDFLNHLFKNLTIALVGDASGLQPAGAAGNLYISLHTADPGEAGDQSTSEAAYGSYARVAVVRSAVGWTVSGNQASNAALITFPACTSGTSAVTHVGIGTDATGAGKLLFSMTGSLGVSSGITPQVAIGALTVTMD